MSKKATKQDRQAALRQRHTAKFAAPESPPGESDPPIIVSGGSVTIYSKVFLSVRQEADGTYVYETDKIKVKRIKTRGKKEQEDESNNGKFRIELRED